MDFHGIQLLVVIHRKGQIFFVYFAVPLSPLLTIFGGCSVLHCMLQELPSTQDHEVFAVRCISNEEEARGKAENREARVLYEKER